MSRENRIKGKEGSFILTHMHTERQLPPCPTSQPLRCGPLPAFALNRTNGLFSISWSQLPPTCHCLPDSSLFLGVCSSRREGTCGAALTLWSLSSHHRRNLSKNLNGHPQPPVRLLICPFTHSSAFWLAWAMPQEANIRSGTPSFEQYV